MSRLAKSSIGQASHKTNTPSNSVVPPPASSSVPFPSSRQSTRTRASASQPTRPPSRLAQIQQQSRPAPVPRRAVTPKPSQSTTRSTLEPKASQAEASDTPIDSHPPGANIKVVVRCRGLTDFERDQQIVLFTGGVRGRELTVNVNNPTTGGEGGGANDAPGALDDPAPHATSNGLANTGYGSSLVEDPKKNANTKTYPFDHVFGFVTSILDSLRLVTIIILITSLLSH